MSDFGSGRSDLGSMRPAFRLDRPDIRSERPDWDSERPALRSERPNLGSERSNIGSQRPNLRSNQSPKGNMWSAIPFALLCMIVNLSEGSRAAAPKGTKSCRTQGDFRSFVLPGSP